MTRPMRFKATLELAGKTATGFTVPDDVVERLGAGKRPPVKVTINGYTYRKEHVRAVEDAKKPETRQRRIAAAVQAVTK